MSQSIESLREEPISGPFTQNELAVAAAEFRARGIWWADVRDLNDAMDRNREARRKRMDAEAQKEAVVPIAKALQPYVDAQRAVEPPPKPVGRPPKELPWLAEVAALYAQGLTLRRALRSVGVVLSYSEVRNIYREKRFKELVAAFRRERGLPDR